MIFADPDARVLAPTRRWDSKGHAGLDDGPFKRANERYDLPKTLELTNRIDDQLAGTVIRNIAAALDLDEIDAVARECVAAEQQVLAFGLASESDYRSVLDDDPRIRFAAFTNSFVKAMLEIPNFAVRFRS